MVKLAATEVTVTSTVSASLPAMAALAPPAFSRAITLVGLRASKSAIGETKAAGLAAAGFAGAGLAAAGGAFGAAGLGLAAAVVSSAAASRRSVFQGMADR